MRTGLEFSSDMMAYPRSPMPVYDSRKSRGSCLATATLRRQGDRGREQRGKRAAIVCGRGRYPTLIDDVPKLYAVENKHKGLTLEPSEFCHTHGGRLYSSHLIDPRELRVTWK